MVGVKTRPHGYKMLAIICRVFQIKIHSKHNSLNEVIQQRESGINFCIYISCPLTHINICTLA